MVLYRTATVSDADAIAAVVTAAFADDPLWGPALSRSDGATHPAERWWALYVAGALRYPTVGVASADGGIDAVTVWIPPGGTELDDDGEAAVRRLAAEELPEQVDALDELSRRFEEVHPHEPHWYLSLFATAPASRGRGIGMALLRDDLARIDDAGLPAYLESSNPANDSRYASVGFEPLGSFTHPTTGAVVTTMWRPARRD